MKQTQIERIPIELPGIIEKLTRGANIFDSSCSPEARVYYIKADTGYYLKCAKCGSLRREAEMDGYFYSMGLGPEVCFYDTGREFDLLLTREVMGEDCTAGKYLDDPRRLAALMGSLLRELHSRDTAACPRQDRLSEYLATAEENYRTGNYDKSHFPDSFGYKSADEAYRVMQEGKHLLLSDTLVHGDFCLPNIMLNNWNLSGYIDLGGAGVADRHIDLFWGAWTLGFNLGTDRYKDIFFDSYGRKFIDKDKLDVIAAIEVFG